MASRLAMFRYCNSGWYRSFGTGMWIDYWYDVLSSLQSRSTSTERSPPLFWLLFLHAGSVFLSRWLKYYITLYFSLYCQLAYYADKTFPEELRRGYKSYFHALRSIPFQEGPYFLFKNTFPFMARNFFQTATAFYAYDYLKDKFGTVTFRISDYPYNLSKGL